MSLRPTLVFDTSSAALWAEEVAQDAGIPVEVVPAPAESDAKCDLAVVCRAMDLDLLEAVLDGQGVPYRRFAPPAG